MSSDAVQPDIEIYVAGIDAAQAFAWIATALAAPLAPPARRGGSWRACCPYGGQAIDVLVVENACDGFTSVCFDSAATPWSSDAACAQAAALHFDCEVRCSAGGWSSSQPVDDDGWLSMRNGATRAITWR